MLNEIPPFEFWLSAPAILSAVTFAFAAGLAVVTFKDISRSLFRWCFVVLIFLTIVQWWVSVRQEADKAKPDRDYVYFFIDPADQALTLDGTVLLSRISTGILDGVKFCFLPTRDYDEYRNAKCATDNFDEGTGHYAFLKPDDWTIDIDPKNRYGKVRQRLDIVQNNGKAVVVLSKVYRKVGGEILCETPPPKDGKPCL